MRIDGKDGDAWLCDTYIALNMIMQLSDTIKNAADAERIGNAAYRDMDGGKGNAHIVRAQHHKRHTANTGSYHLRLSGKGPSDLLQRMLVDRQGDHGIGCTVADAVDGAFKRRYGKSRDIVVRHARRYHCRRCKGIDRDGIAADLPRIRRNAPWKAVCFDALFQHGWRDGECDIGIKGCVL
jgi:hypothetical protein